jgi:hypothetical protein
MIEMAVPAERRRALLLAQRTELLALVDRIRAGAAGGRLTASASAVVAELEHEAEVLEDRARRFAPVEKLSRHAGSGCLLARVGVATDLERT